MQQALGKGIRMLVSLYARRCSEHVPIRQTDVSLRPLRRAPRLHVFHLCVTWGMLRELATTSTYADSASARISPYAFKRVPPRALCDPLRIDVANILCRAPCYSADEYPQPPDCWHRRWRQQRELRCGSSRAGLCTSMHPLSAMSVCVHYRGEGSATGSLKAEATFAWRV
jgi:hypothetical protein